MDNDADTEEHAQVDPGPNADHVDDEDGLNVDGDDSEGDNEEASSGSEDVSVPSIGYGYDSKWESMMSKSMHLIKIPLFTTGRLIGELDGGERGKRKRTTISNLPVARKRVKKEVLEYMQESVFETQEPQRVVDHMTSQLLMLGPKLLQGKSCAELFAKQGKHSQPSVEKGLQLGGPSVEQTSNPTECGESDQRISVATRYSVLNEYFFRTEIEATPSSITVRLCQEPREKDGTGRFLDHITDDLIHEILSDKSYKDLLAYASVNERLFQIVKSILLTRTIKPNEAPRIFSSNVPRYFSPTTPVFKTLPSTLLQSDPGLVAAYGLYTKIMEDPQECPVTLGPTTTKALEMTPNFPHCIKLCSGSKIKEAFFEKPREGSDPGKKDQPKGRSSKECLLVPNFPKTLNMVRYKYTKNRRDRNRNDEQPYSKATNVPLENSFLQESEIGTFIFETEWAAKPLITASLQRVVKALHRTNTLVVQMKSVKKYGRYWLRRNAFRGKKNGGDLSLDALVGFKGSVIVLDSVAICSMKSMPNEKNASVDDMEKRRWERGNQSVKVLVLLSCLVKDSLLNEIATIFPRLEVLRIHSESMSTLEIGPPWPEKDENGNDLAQVEKEKWKIKLFALSYAYETSQSLESFSSFSRVFMTAVPGDEVRSVCEVLKGFQATAGEMFILLKAPREDHRSALIRELRDLAVKGKASAVSLFTPDPLVDRLLFHYSAAQ